MKKVEKRNLLFSTVFICFLLVTFSIPVVVAEKEDLDYGTMAKLLPSNGEIYGWIRDLWKIEYKSEIGFRQAGSTADHESANYILDKFNEFGLEDVHLETISEFPYWKAEHWSLEVNIGEEVEEIPCTWRPRTAFTDQDGISAEIIYVGLGMEEADFLDVEGKIVVVDLIGLGLDNDLLMMFSPYWYDRDNTLPGEKVHLGGLSLMLNYHMTLLLVMVLLAILAFLIF